MADEYKIKIVKEDPDNVLKTLRKDVADASNEFLKLQKNTSSNSNELQKASLRVTETSNALKNAKGDLQKLGVGTNEFQNNIKGLQSSFSQFTNVFSEFKAGTQGGISGLNGLSNAGLELAGSLSPATIALGGIGAVIGIMVGEVYLGVKAFETFISTYEKLSDLALQGAEFTELRKHFDDINGGTEIGKEKLLEFQHAADNHLNNEELIKFANTEKEANLNTNESIQLLDLATRKHHELGKTIEETNQAFLKYLQTGTTRGLATVLNVPELKKAQEDIAKSYKMVFSKLDEESQARIRKIALLNIEGKTVDEIKNKELTHAGVISTLKTEYANLMLNAKALLSEGFTPLASGVNLLVEKLKDMGAKIIEQLGGIDHIKVVMIDWAKRITDYIIPILEKFITKIGNVISSIIEFAKRNTILIQGFEELGRFILKTVDMIGTGLQAVISSTITAIKFMIDSVIGGFVLLLKGANMIKSLVGGDTQAGYDLISQLESLKSDTGAGTHTKKSGQGSTSDDFTLTNKDKPPKKEKTDSEEDLLAILKSELAVKERDKQLTAIVTDDLTKRAKVIEGDLRTQLALTTTFKEQNAIQTKITDAVNFEIELEKKRAELMKNVLTINEKHLEAMLRIKDIEANIVIVAMENTANYYAHLKDLDNILAKSRIDLIENEFDKRRAEIDDTYRLEAERIDKLRSNVSNTPEEKQRYDDMRNNLNAKYAKDTFKNSADKAESTVKNVLSNVSNIMNILGVKTDSFVSQLIAGFQATISIVESIANILSSIIGGGSGVGGFFSSLLNIGLGFLHIPATIGSGGGGGRLLNINNYRPNGNGRMTQPIYIMGTMSGQTFMRVESSKYANRQATKAV